MLPVLVIDAFLNQYHSSCSLKKESTCHENRDWNHCRVLDMCASPGSKTLQLYEHDPKLLIANDIHPGRLEALKDAIVRSGVPHAAEKIILTCQDATKIEFMAKKAKHSTTTISNDNKAPSLLKFDVILCDVPCSGDGTCRKDPHVLRNWKPSIGNQLHSTQVAILSRAVELLKKNGVICYSTCSLNPVENEAVVAAVLHKYGNNIELVQIPTISSRLMLRDGMSQWKVAHWNDDQNNGIFQDELDGEDDGCGACLQLTWLDSYDDAVKGTKIRSTVKQWMPSLWPPPTSTGAPDMNLSYCKRLWPHDQNSGGFFVALLRNRTK
jgi:16S rRNA C967 or C1407 C5-methylase (RsmB/RsmF family)